MNQEKSNNNIVSIMTNCSICNKLITKKNYEDGIYVCSECQELHDLEKAIKIYELQQDDDNLMEEFDRIIEKIYNSIEGDFKNE